MISEKIHPTVKDQEISGEIRLKGVGAARGYAIGKAYLYKRDAIIIDRRVIHETDVADEQDKYRKSVEQSNRELVKISTITHQKLGEEFSAIFDAQILMLFDPEITRLILDFISNGRMTAESATDKAYSQNIDLLKELSADHPMTQRITDLEDVKERVIRNLQRGKLLSRVEESSIIVSDNLTPADMILFSRQNIQGIALNFGGLNSHVALIARSLNIPLVIGLHKASSAIHPGDDLIIDGTDGYLIARPSAVVMEKYHRKIEKFARFIRLFDQSAQGESVTADGRKVTVNANIEFRDELSQLDTCGAEGVGLYRTEHLFLSRGYFPSEEQQYSYYKSLFELVGHHPVTIRAFDVGGDKVLESSFQEQNPFLGWRGVRILLDRPEIFRNQMRAILRAAYGHRVKLMFPMVHNLGQVRLIKSHMNELITELKRLNVPFNPVPVGIMIEIPSAAIQAPVLAREVEFFSLGTNDLTQYTLAVDRGNDIIAGLYRELEPAVLYLIYQTILAGRQAGIPVSICGELASNLLAIPLLVGMGIDEISVIIRRAPEVRYVIQNVKQSDCEVLVGEVLALTTVSDIEQHLRSWMQSHLPALGHYL